MDSFTTTKLFLCCLDNDRACGFFKLESYGDILQLYLPNVNSDHVNEHSSGCKIPTTTQKKQSNGPDKSY